MPDNSIDRTVSRRTVLKAAAATGLALSTHGLVELLAQPTMRLAMAAPATLPDIQFDIRAFVPPAQTVDGVVVRFGPVFTRFVTLKLARTPDLADQQRLVAALAAIEGRYPFNPGGVFVFMAYGIPYFKRLPGGMRGGLVRGYIPRLRSARNRLALEEAVAGPTDVARANPGIKKAAYHVPVAIEANDVLLTVRSDVLGHTSDVVDWLLGRSNRLNGAFVASPDFNGLLAVTSNRLMFQQMGLPRRVADEQHLPFAARVSDRSPMWMGFADQQASGSGPPEITTFQGNPSAALTSCGSADYMRNGAIQHLSHVILTSTRSMRCPMSPLPNGFSTRFGPTRFRPSATATSSAAGVGRRSWTTCSRVSTMPERTPPASRLSKASVGWDTSPRCSVHHGRPMGRPSTFAWTGRGTTRWMSRTAALSRNSSSPCSCRPPTFSQRCAETRPRSTWFENTGSPMKTMGWSDSSPPHGGRTSLSLRGDTGRFRYWRSPMDMDHHSRAINP